MSAHESPLQQFLTQCGQGVVEVEHLVLGSVKRVPHLKHDHPPVNNVNVQVTTSFSLMERVALFITERVGSFGFFLLIAAWSAIWLLWNTHAPKALRFDPAPAFVIWLFISNLIQLSLLPLIMVGQNLLSRHSELRSEEDFRINQKAEQEAQAILLHLEHQTAQIERHGELILEILQRLEKSETAGGTPEGWKDKAMLPMTSGQPA